MMAPQDQSKTKVQMCALHQRHKPCCRVFISILVMYNPAQLHFWLKQQKNSQFCYKIGVGLVDCGNVGQEFCLWFPSQDSSTFMMNQYSVFIGIHIMNNPVQLLFCTITQNIVMTGDQTSREPYLTSGHAFCGKCSVWQDECELANFTAMNVFQGSILDIWKAKKCPCRCFVLPGSIFCQRPPQHPCSPKWGLFQRKGVNLEYKSIYDSLTRCREPFL